MPNEYTVKIKGNRMKKEKKNNEGKTTGGSQALHSQSSVARRRARAIRAGLCDAVLRVFGQHGLINNLMRDPKMVKENLPEAPERVIYALRPS
jgi:hypothetical protein